MSSVFWALRRSQGQTRLASTPAWRREQAGAFLWQPPLIRGRIDIPGMPEGKRRWGAPKCEPRERRARRGVHRDVSGCVCELAGSREIAPSRMEPAISSRRKGKKRLRAKARPREGRCCHPDLLLGGFNLSYPRLATWKTDLEKVRRCPLPQKEKVRVDGGR